MPFSFKEEIAPFKPRNIKFYVLGDVLFFLSFWLIQLNLSWVIYTITRSPLHLGVLGFLVNLPLLIMLPFSGILADRFNRRKIILLAQVIWAIPTLLLIIVSSLGKVHLGLIFFVGLIYGSLFALVKPSSDAMIRDIVEHKKDLHRIIGVDSAANKVMQFVASALNAIIRVIWVTTSTAAFVVSIILTTFAFICFFKVKPRQYLTEESKEKPMHQLVEGFRYVFSLFPVWTTMIMGAIALIITIALLFQLPVFAGTILAGDIHYLNYLYIAAGVGGMGGGVILALRVRSKGLLKLMTLAMLILGLALIGFALSRIIYLSVIFMFMTDGCVIFIFASCAAAIQYLIVDAKRGRVMSIYSMFCVGLMPFGILIMGVVGYFIGITITVIATGVICLIAAVVYWMLMPKNKRLVDLIYQELRTEDPEAGQKLF